MYNLYINYTPFLLFMCIHTAPGLPPEDTRVQVHDAYSMRVSWRPPSSEQNGLIIGYTINLTLAYVDILPTQHFSNTTYIYLTGLIPHSTYHVQVAAVTVAVGPYSDLIYAIIPETGRCIGIWLITCYYLNSKSSLFIRYLA